ncbi:MAG: class III signal peptide-containing protein [Candidatus Diapherotrites archaeon]|jgi:hypothetical protein|uniref:Class III signal peptide-containing protein n=1 Tax=Candidatus Iainarchaeum sp. TaxID=3101447 RepID=A0A8T5GFB0_9ARCH|nr:class III signal peptide-containing protein [Candidatus Diapherotrites archaeon]MBT7241042.1 class III signal peptide-containing protein [Candidatus Diapherotrites archaeon]
MTTSKKTKAQGTLEYLLIIAVVIVIALILVSILTGFLGQGSQVSETQSKIYWSSQPLAITESVTDTDGNTIFVIKSSMDESITITFITVDGDLKLSATGSYTYGNIDVIGAEANSGTSRNFDGLIDEVMIFDKALTQEEILLLYNSGNGRSLEE